MKANPYETRQYLNEYLLLHYASPGDLCPFPFIPLELRRFHERIRAECLDPFQPRLARLSAPEGTRALDIGCAVGRFTFELGRLVDHAVGIDNSRLFIHMAARMARQHHLTARVRESGRQFKTLQLSLPNQLRRSRVEFKPGEAMDLRPFYRQPFHIVSAINLICRLPRPAQFLRQIHRLLARGGLLVLASPATWVQQFTPASEWLTDAQIRDLLGPHFRLLRRRDIPLLVREHRRKYELVISQVMVFQAPGQP